MTGREKLMTMTDEQIAKAMRSSCDCCAYIRDDASCASQPCWVGIRIWLGNEVSDDDDD